MTKKVYRITAWEVKSEDPKFEGYVYSQKIVLDKWEAARGKFEVNSVFLYRDHKPSAHIRDNLIWTEMEVRS